MHIIIMHVCICIIYATVSVCVCVKMGRSRKFTSSQCNINRSTRSINKKKEEKEESNFGMNIFKLLYACLVVNVFVGGASSYFAH